MAEVVSMLLIFALYKFKLLKMQGGLKSESMMKARERNNCLAPTNKLQRPPRIPSLDALHWTVLYFIAHISNDSLWQSLQCFALEQFAEHNFERFTRRLNSYLQICLLLKSLSIKLLLVRGDDHQSPQAAQTVQMNKNVQSVCGKLPLAMSRRQEFSFFLGSFTNSITNTNTSN